MITPLFFNGCNFHKTDDAKISPRDFPYISVPAMLSGQEAAVYAASHFWKRYFDSTEAWSGMPDTLIGGVSAEEMTAAVREYIMTLWSIPYGEAVAAQEKLMASAEESLQQDTSGTIYGFIVSTMESALWNPLSELRNEGFYIPVAESILRTGMTGSRDSQYYSRQLASCRNNRPGSRAADFTYTDSKGRMNSLHAVTGEYTVLLFSNPGCPACREIISILKDSPQINAMVQAGRLTLLSIYIDEDLAEWYKGLSDYPHEWITGYNQDLSIRDCLTYDVRAIPSLYFLDKDKNVIFKDISPNMLMMQLQNFPL